MANLASGNLLQVNVHAVAGVTNVGTPAINYDPSGPVVTFVCHGATLTYSCSVPGYTEDNNILE